jgi:HlyD family secretion protein
VRALRGQLAEAHAALTLARERERDSVLRSPVTGVVVSRELEPGAIVNPGTAILKLADLGTAWVTVHVDEREIGHVAPGVRAEVSLRSLPGRTLSGTVARVRRESDRVTEQLAVDVAFTERPARLTLGEQAEARIVPPAVRAAAAIPLAAVVRRPEGTGALTVVDGRLAFRPARLGVADGRGWVEVLQGLAPGDRVVLAPGRLAAAGTDGRRVRVIAADPGAAHAGGIR